MVPRRMCSWMDVSGARSVSNAILALGGNQGNVAGEFQRGLEALEDNEVKVNNLLYIISYHRASNMVSRLRPGHQDVPPICVTTNARSRSTRVRECSSMDPDQSPSNRTSQCAEGS